MGLRFRLKPIHFISFNSIFSDIASLEFRPDIMEQWTIPITLVAGGKDKKSPPSELRKKFNVLKSGKNANLFSFVNFN